MICNQGNYIGRLYNRADKLRMCFRKDTQTVCVPDLNDACYMVGLSETLTKNKRRH